VNAHAKAPDLDAAPDVDHALHLALTWVKAGWMSLVVIDWRTRRMFRDGQQVSCHTETAVNALSAMGLVFEPRSSECLALTGAGAQRLADWDARLMGIPEVTKDPSSEDMTS
jgi:hypothetical protein